MAWTCYSCGTKNPGKADTCSNCGGNVAAPKSFYLQWVFGGAFFFLITYLMGIFIGTTLVEFKATPSEEVVLAKAQEIGKAQQIEIESLMTGDAEIIKAARAEALAEAKAKMSPILQILIMWSLPALLFIICGIIVGFVSDGKTIWEAGFGSILGQSMGIVFVQFGFDTPVSWVVGGVGAVAGFGLALLGAWLGEIIQERKEREV